MFSTFQYNTRNDDTEVIKRTSDPSLGPTDGPRSLACQRCRSKKQRCSGQKGGCDRCKRNSTACIYSPDNKGRISRQHRITNEKSRSNSPGGSPAAVIAAAAAAGPSKAPSNHQDELEDVRNQQRTSKPISSLPVERGQDAHNEDDMNYFFSPLNSPVENPEDDWTMTNEFLQDILPDYSYQKPDDQWEMMSLQNSAQVDNSNFCNSGHSNNTSADLVPSMPSSDHSMSHFPSSSHFNTTSHLLSPPLASMQRPLSTTPKQAPTPKESFNVPRLPRTQHGLDNHHHSHGPKGIPSSHDSPIRCRCLWTIGVLLEELERNNQPADPAALDVNLSSQKKALAHCKTILKCSTCVARSEYILILGLIAQKLVASYESSVSVYMRGVQQQQQQQQQRRRSSSSSVRVVESNSNPNRIRHHHHHPPHHHHSQQISTSEEEAEESNSNPVTTTTNNNINQKRHIFFGDYEIDSPDEWNALIRVIICLQLRTFQSLLLDMKDAAATDGAARAKVAEMPVVRVTERRIAALMCKLRQPVPFPKG